MLTEKIQNSIETWLRLDQNEKTKNEVEKLIETNNTEELIERFGERINFGTSGLRSKMGAGFSFMNELVCIQTTQGLCSYLDECQPNWKIKGVVIGFDKRYNSSEFAVAIASVIIGLGGRVFLIEEYCPTPFVPFAVSQYKAACGIMITASHNPKDDNGYKLYWDNAALIISPHDKNIQASILKNLELFETNISLEKVLNHHLCFKIFSDVFELYKIKMLGHSSFTAEEREKVNVPIVYTAMHGVGYRFIKDIHEYWGFPDVIPTELQVQPDPEFPTVKFPNPEEGEGALKLAIETAEKNNVKIVVANDPDADRFIFAEKQTNGEWKIFSGNEIAAIFAPFLLEKWVKMNPDKTRDQAAFVTTVVSSRFLKYFSQAEGCQFVETLVGFKWMANKANELVEQGIDVLMCYEQAIGFAMGPPSYDKDGIIASLLFREIVQNVYEDGLTLGQYVDSLYAKYGYFKSNDGYVLTDDKEKILQVYEDIGRYPKEVNGQQVIYVRDLHIDTPFDSDTTDNKPTFPLSSSPFLTFIFENDSQFTLRTSGTEPKLKWYGESKANSVEEAKLKIDAIVEEIIQKWIRPDERGFEKSA
eukprot:TRINITY_DN3191_c4_g2_i1.p1 TRINITY_DN3191_c4_g2~~TRINITY_DN3191_c4_g2_i1.p1  ORF type:complete len:588 (+),score=190.86 TRINITY_DN3191_c4_g2_i1:69-1832(+)